MSKKSKPRRSEKMKAKKYEKELRKLQAELVPSPGVGQAQGAARHHRLRGPRRRGQGRHHPGDHRAGQPARVPPGRAAGAVGPREVADVHAALHAAFPGGRRDRDLRPQLVQPRRRRVRDGLLHEGAARALPRTVSRDREVHRRRRHPAHQDLAGGRATRSRSAASRRASTTRSASGSSARWTCPRAASGSSTPAPAT